jgi:hypothetical protein
MRAAFDAGALGTLVALAALPWRAAPAAAQSRTGTAVGQFMLIEPSARFTAIGNSGVALDGGLDGAYYNPAAAGRITRLAFLLTHIDWLAGIRCDYVATAIPFGDRGTGFVTVSSLNSGEIDVRTVAQPLGTGERYTVSDIALGLGFARPISDRFSAGVQVKYVQETIWHTSAGAVTFDVGSAYRIRPDGLHIGSSITNFGTSATFSGRDLRITYDGVPDQSGDNSTLPGQRFVEGHPVPVLFRVGVGLPWRPAPDWRIWFSADAQHPNFNPEHVNAGVEATFRDLASLRIGYQGLLQEDSEEGLALGAGFHGQLELFDYRIDYAWSDHGRLGDVHRLTLALLH